MTQQDLADGAQCHANYLGELERGKVNATSENLLYIAAALGVLPEALWRGYTLVDLEGLGEKVP